MSNEHEERARNAKATKLAAYLNAHDLHVDVLDALERADHPAAFWDAIARRANVRSPSRATIERACEILRLWASTRERVVTDTDPFAGLTEEDQR